MGVQLAKLALLFPLELVLLVKVAPLVLLELVLLVKLVPLVLLEPVRLVKLVPLGLLDLLALLVPLELVQQAKLALLEHRQQQGNIFVLRGLLSHGTRCVMVSRTVRSQKQLVEARMRKGIVGVVEVTDRDENKSCIQMKAYIGNNWQINKLVFQKKKKLVFKKKKKKKKKKK